VYLIAVKPQVGMQRDITVVEGEKLKLECLVIGTPPPEISWTFGKYPFIQFKVTTWLCATV
jgi:hypothetical protein